MQLKLFIWIASLCGILSLALTSGELMKEPSTSTSLNDKLVAMNHTLPPKSGDLNLTEIIQKCNETYTIAKNYLEELNETGSYPDETEATPMCFMKCYLEQTGILDADNKINMDRAIEMTWSNSEDAIVDCKAEMVGDPCEQAYFLARCVTTRALVDGRSQDAKK